MPHDRHKLFAFCAAIMIWLAAPAVQATPQPAPPGGPIAEFAANDPHSIQTYSYTLWARILDAVIEQDDKGNNSVNYGGLGIQGRDALDAFVNEMTNTPVAQLNRNEQLAFWLNLYNAATLRAMFDRFNALGSGGQDFASRNPWADTQRLNIKKMYTDDDNPWAVRNLTVSGVTLSLNDIEHRILYAYWKPGLVLYGLSCPLRGCPALSKAPFQGSQAERQLAAAAERFIADTDNVKLKGGALRLSELYEWHQAALGGETGVLAHLREHAGARRAELATATQIASYDFSWKLAGKPPPSSRKMPRGQINRGAGAGGSFQE
ncbi:DUF547 domain-containing protein [Emcibacter sp. SYSU 3D8]|uniref:DUF547 domain-containing protein n=1 Tax=Emcibacter sp. SYSU 3D8 TaxID=3133969 RepID=UPI0031FEAAA8